MVSKQPEMHISVDRQDDVTVVSIRGSVNMMDVDRFRDQLLEAMKAEQDQDLIVDLSGMDFINSLGLGVLVAVQREMKRQQHRLKLVHPQQSIQKMLETTKLTRIFAIFPDVTAAASAPRVAKQH